MSESSSSLDSGSSDDSYDYFSSSSIENNVGSDTSLDGKLKAVATTSSMRNRKRYTTYSDSTFDDRSQQSLFENSTNDLHQPRSQELANDSGFCKDTESKVEVKSVYVEDWGDDCVSTFSEPLVNQRSNHSSHHSISLHSPNRSDPYVTVKQKTLQFNSSISTGRSATKVILKSNEAELNVINLTASKTLSLDCKSGSSGRTVVMRRNEPVKHVYVSQQRKQDSLQLTVSKPLSKSQSHQSNAQTKHKLLPSYKSFPSPLGNVRRTQAPSKHLKPIKGNPWRNVKELSLRDRIISESKAAGEACNFKPPDLEKSEVLENNSNLKLPQVEYSSPKRKPSRSKFFGRNEKDTLQSRHFNGKSEQRLFFRKDLLKNDSILDLQKLVSHSSCSTISSVTTVKSLELLSDVSLTSLTHEHQQVKNPFLRKKLKTDHMLETLNSHKFYLMKSSNPTYQVVNAAYDNIIQRIETDLDACAIRWFLFKIALCTEQVANIMPFPRLFFKQDVLDVKYMKKVAQMNANLAKFNTDDSLSIQLILWVLTLNPSLEFKKCPKASCCFILNQMTSLLLSFTPCFMFSLIRPCSALSNGSPKLTLFCPAPLSVLFTVMNGNKNALALNGNNKRGMFGFNSIKKCMKFINNKITDSCKIKSSSSKFLQTLEPKLYTSSGLVTFETFAILIIELSKEPDSKDTFTNKSNETIVLIENPSDFEIKHVMLYEAGTFHGVMKNLGKGIEKQAKPDGNLLNVGENALPDTLWLEKKQGSLSHAGRTSETTPGTSRRNLLIRIYIHLFLLVGSIVLTLCMVYFGYVVRIQEQKRLELLMEVDMSRMASKGRTWSTVFRDVIFFKN
ncbi:hypothetical protein WDU94_009992 [Cyamophila willieti]